MIGRDADRASAALGQAGGNGIAVAADVTRKADADHAIGAAVQAFGRVDVIVNAVGGGAGGALYPAEEYPESEWDRMLDLNLRSRAAADAGRRAGDDRRRQRRPRAAHLLGARPARASTTASRPTSPPRARSTR